MNLIIKLLITFMTIVLGSGAYYFYNQQQEKQEVQKSQDIREKIWNAPHTKGIY